ncbi:glycosyltransferase [Cuneatibacter sp. NSJ-177]|uniref:glycosyltransferase family 2 protein n=1 Tax=Cuneatibacter sp. NSJ-177 TaxID=2931401 RepID=UPI001FD0E6ED|nr:glycosyltransferase [Cuneatibacter sp. NSJ-177]MCJ7836931.1 glycosyltransferase [Cuneatibacter sp. NSJ-177]
MTNEYKVSVIVPVYNAGPFLDRCLASICAQTYKNLEVVIIDDGSTDNSPTISREYALKDSRIIFVSQENSGVSAARNSGLDIVSGKYVTFVDADDYIKENHIENLYNAIAGRDIGITALYNVSAENKRQKSWGANTVLTREQLFEETVCDSYIGGYLWNKIFLRDIINREQLRLSPDISISEDMLWICQYLMFCTSGYYSCEPTYYYVRNDQSAMRKMYEEHCFDIRKASSLEAARRMKNLTKNETQTVKDAINYRWVRVRLWILMNMIFCGYRDKNLFNQIKDIQFFQLKAYLKNKAGKGIEKACALIMFLSPHFLYWSARIFGKLFFTKFREKLLN